MTRNKHNKVPILLVAIALASATQAAEIKQGQVIDAAETWVRYITADARENAVIEELEAYEVEGVAVAYIAHLDDGYCICGADDRLLPVYLYNAKGKFDPANPNYQFILDEIATRYFKIVDAESKNAVELEQYSDLLNQRAIQWGQLIAGEIPEVAEEKDLRGTPTYMTLPVKTYWRQGSPFSDYCPELTPGADEHTITGCVATAMAQIMYYWKWPASGSGSRSGTYDYRYSTIWLLEPCATDPQLPGSWITRLHWSGGYLHMKGYWDGTLYSGAQNEDEDNSDYQTALSNLWSRMTTDSTNFSVNFGTATYNWSIMPLNASDPPSTSDLEAAEISYHCGVAVGMDYGVWASSAFTSNTPWSYRTYFDYDPDVVFWGRSTVTMMNELQWYRPVQLKGQSDSGGHSWVIAGYNDNVSPTQFLMNMGWGGGSTDWYTCDDVFPNDQGHAVRIAPEGVVRFVESGLFVSGDGTPNDPYVNLVHATDSSPENTTLIMKAGSTHQLVNDPLIFDKPMTYKGYDVRIEKQ